MELLALGIGLGRPGELEGCLRKVALHRHVVLARLAHVLAQHLSDEARHAHVALRRVHARPRGGFPVEGDGDVLHRRFLAFSAGKDITRTSCIYATAPARALENGSPSSTSSLESAAFQ